MCTGREIVRRPWRVLGPLVRMPWVAVCSNACSTVRRPASRSTSRQRLAAPKARCQGERGQEVERLTAQAFEQIARALGLQNCTLFIRYGWGLRHLCGVVTKQAPEFGLFERPVQDVMGVLHGPWCQSSPGQGRIQSREIGGPEGL